MEVLVTVLPKQTKDSLNWIDAASFNSYCWEKFLPDETNQKHAKKLSQWRQAHLASEDCHWAPR